MKMLIGLLAASLCAIGTQDKPAPVFRSGADGVTVDVAVFDGDKAVTALGPSDFELYDNGVRQTVAAADRNTLPIDLRLVFDTSGSITESDLDRYRQAMRHVTATLRPGDRCEIVTFGTQITDAARPQSPPITIALTRGGPDGTSFFDAVSLSLVTTPMFDRRQIVIILSDAQDNSSFFDEATMMDAAKRTDAVVYTVQPANVPAVLAPYAARLQALSLLTGGRLVPAQFEHQISGALIEALDEFRQSYAVRYTVHGVASSGWHRLKVNVRAGRRYSVRARAGYFGR